VAYAHISEKELLPFSHPLDTHFAVAGLQVSSADYLSFTFCSSWFVHRLLTTTGLGIASLKHSVVSPRSSWTEDPVRIWICASTTESRSEQDRIEPVETRGYTRPGVDTVLIGTDTGLSER